MGLFSWSMRSRSAIAIGALSASSGIMRQPRRRLESESRWSESPETTSTGSPTSDT